jgi:hypothetical protein
MTKKNQIKKAEALLKEAGFTHQDYVISLQGPTVIFAQSGEAKLAKDLTVKAELFNLKIAIL